MLSTLFIKSMVALLGIGSIIFAWIFFKRKRSEITLLVVSTVLAIMACEFLLRIFFPQFSNHVNMFERDPVLGWRFISNGVWEYTYQGGVRSLVKTNAAGFRDNPPASDKEKKLLVLGDSFVSNVAVSEDEVFTEVMERQLKNYDVLNFGVNGYGQVQEYLLLQKCINEIKPDAVVLTIYLRNDFMDNTGAYWGYSRPYASLEGQDSILVIHPESHPASESQQKNSSPSLFKSHLNVLINRSLNKIILEDSLLAPPEFFLCQWPIPRKEELMFRIMGQLLVKISDLGRENKIPVIFVIAPSLVQIEDELWESFLKKNSKYEKKFLRSLPNDWLMEFAQRNDLKMLDLFSVFLRESKKNVKLYHREEQHWTKEGNRVVANALIDYLQSESVIE